MQENKLKLCQEKLITPRINLYRLTFGQNQDGRAHSAEWVIMGDLGCRRRGRSQSAGDMYESLTTPGHTRGSFTHALLVGPPSFASRLS